jgi:hypothetical protein
MRKLTMPSDTPNFTTRITVGGEVFNASFRWNVSAERWAMGVTNSNGDTLFKGMFVATGVRYCRLFVGFPENTEIVFIGDETDDTFKNLFMVISDDAESEFTD